MAYRNGQQYPIIVNKAKYIVPTKNTLKHQNKSKTTIAIIGNNDYKVTSDLSIKETAIKNGHNLAITNTFKTVNSSNNCSKTKRSETRNDEVDNNINDIKNKNAKIPIHEDNKPNSANNQSKIEKQDKSHKQLTGLSKHTAHLKKHFITKYCKNKKGRQLQIFIYRRILLTVNILTLIFGLITLIFACIFDPQPLHRINTTGAKISLASIYAIFISLIGLYGTRLKQSKLLFIYALTILIALIFCSLYFIISLYYFHNFVAVIISVGFAIFEIFLISISLTVAFYLQHLSKMQTKAPSSQTV